MEATTPKKTRKRKPHAWLVIDGVRHELVVPKPTRLSAAALFMKEHPNGIWKINDMRAVMK
jgi:hypothetical protein